jgi:hypothetical protein
MPRPLADITSGRQRSSPAPAARMRRGRSGGKRHKRFRIYRDSFNKNRAAHNRESNPRFLSADPDHPIIVRK